MTVIKDKTIQQFLDELASKSANTKNEIADLFSKQQIHLARQKRLELEKAKARLLSRLEVIQNPQTSRPEMVKALDAIPRLLPENIYLLTLKSDGAQLTLKGIANSNNTISTFMRNLAESAEFGEPVLTVVENRDINDIRASVFELSVKLETTPPDNPPTDKPVTAVKR